MNAGLVSRRLLLLVGLLATRGDLGSGAGDYPALSRRVKAPVLRAADELQVGALLSLFPLRMLVKHHYAQGEPR